MLYFASGHWHQGQGTMVADQGLEYHGAWTARDTVERCAARPGLEGSCGAKSTEQRAWSKGQAMELKGRQEAHHRLKLSTRDEIGKMYTAHYAPSRTVYGRFGYFGQSV